MTYVRAALHIELSECSARLAQQNGTDFDKPRAHRHIVRDLRAVRLSRYSLNAVRATVRCVCFAEFRPVSCCNEDGSDTYQAGAGDSTV